MNLEIPKLSNTKKIIILLVAVFAIALFIHEKNYRKPVNIVEYEIVEDNLLVTLDGQGSICMADEMNYDPKAWFKTDENNQVSIPINDYSTNLYVRNSQGFDCGSMDNIDLSHPVSITITSGDVYLAIDGQELLTYETEEKGEVKQKVMLKSKDESIATVDENNIIHGVSNGKTSIVATYGDKTDSINVLVTDLITVAPREFDESKPYLPCGRYNKEENDLLDEILASRVEKAGHHTRAGVVAAARFLALEFPYRINYFLENGRKESYVNRYCDGEGRYYHVGLYLDPSRFENIDPDMVVGGKACWGCETMEYSNNRIWRNGLDCSGFVSWAILNGGFDCHDLGAGIAYYWPDLTDLGEKIWLPDAMADDSLRVGDLLAGGEGGPTDGGHIAIVAGIDSDGYIYVAEELNYANAWGYFIKKYDKAKLMRYFYWRVDMEDYYHGEDGNLTNFWMEEE